MKLRRFRFDGYKALDDLTVSVPRDQLFLIGTNGAGKSSILQALAFVRAFAEGETRAFLKDRHWQTSDLRPRVKLRTIEVAKSNRRIRILSSSNFSCSILLEDSSGAQVVWQFAWGYSTEQNLSEEIWTRSKKDAPFELTLEYNRSTRAQGSQSSHDSFRIDDLSVEGSVFANLRLERFARDGQTDLLREFRDWALGITSLELLSPIAMRSNVRGSPKDIGARGERLTGFIAALSSIKKRELAERVRRFYPLSTIDTVKKTAGWIDMLLQESFPNTAVIRPAHMSDGFMRILALCSIPDFQESVSLILLDEVEDGIEPHILPDLISYVTNNTKAQIILTSHSPLLINYFDRDQVCFLTRREDGTTALARSDEMQMFSQAGEVFGVGEIWVNAQSSTVTDQVIGHATTMSAEDVGVDPAERVRLFAEGL